MSSENQGVHHSRLPITLMSVLMLNPYIGVSCAVEDEVSEGNPAGQWNDDINQFNTSFQSFLGRRVKQRAEIRRQAKTEIAEYLGELDDDRLTLI